MRFTGRRYASARDGTTVVDARTGPAGQAPPASVLTGLVRDAVG